MAHEPIFDDVFYVVKGRRDYPEAVNALNVMNRAPFLALDEMRQARALSNAGVPVRRRVAEVFFINPIMQIVDGDLGVPPSPLATDLKDEYGHFEFVSATAKRFYDRHDLPLPGDIIGTLKRSQLPRVLGTQLRLEIYEPQLRPRPERDRANL